MIYEIVEIRKQDGHERVIRTVSSKPTAERAVLMRRNALAVRGKLDEYEVEARRAERNDSGRTD